MIFRLRPPGLTFSRHLDDTSARSHRNRTKPLHPLITAVSAARGGRIVREKGCDEQGNGAYARRDDKGHAGSKRHSTSLAPCIDSGEYQRA
eukprot:CAMPEP_0167772330 /NCGR_PEP_ID=MMETSP0111_2-20121227/788_1 /TAXON_ID=91324 /ORGANISM="Lotharella globosa, Strain CCCM811" /LENGTH=90 /DNA_ID=CAMNT_0007661811 /DNA_START=255 /DNA_END=527 /DNA_ORIENTATION=+